MAPWTAWEGARSKDLLHPRGNEDQRGSAGSHGSTGARVPPPCPLSCPSPRPHLATAGHQPTVRGQDLSWRGGLQGVPRACAELGQPQMWQEEWLFMGEERGRSHLERPQHPPHQKAAPGRENSSAQGSAPGKETYQFQLFLELRQGSPDFSILFSPAGQPVRLSSGGRATAGEGIREQA